MPNYILNEVENGPTGPSSNRRVTAEGYEEKGSFTVFSDAEGKEVFSMQTAKIRTIRVVDEP